MLEEIVRVVPAPAVAELRKVPLWFSPEYKGTGPRAEYHPDAGWLRANDRDPAMAKAIEFTNVRIFDAELRRMPNFALHELAHAFHDRVLSFDEPRIRAAFEQPKASGKYESVRIRNGAGKEHTGRAYTISNHKEYFAETTEAFFSRNDIYPFTRDELKEHDPEMFACSARCGALTAERAGFAASRRALAGRRVNSAGWRSCLATSRRIFGGAKVRREAAKVRGGHSKCEADTPAARRHSSCDVDRKVRGEYSKVRRELFKGREPPRSWATRQGCARTRQNGRPTLTGGWNNSFTLVRRRPDTRGGAAAYGTGMKTTLAFVLLALSLPRLSACGAPPIDSNLAVSADSAVAEAAIARLRAAGRRAWMHFFGGTAKALRA
jgi:hypothetical protein